MRPGPRAPSERARREREEQARYGYRSGRSPQACASECSGLGWPGGYWYWYWYWSIDAKGNSGVMRHRVQGTPSTGWHTVPYEAAEASAPLDAAPRAAGFPPVLATGGHWYWYWYIDAKDNACPTAFSAYGRNTSCRMLSSATRYTHVHVCGTVVRHGPPSRGDCPWWLYRLDARRSKDADGHLKPQAAGPRWRRGCAIIASQLDAQRQAVRHPRRVKVAPHLPALRAGLVHGTQRQQPQPRWI